MADAKTRGLGTIAAATATERTTLSALAALDSGDVLARLDSTADGLSGTEAAQRLQRYGANEVSGESRSFWSIVRDQLRSVINILLALAGVLTIATGDLVDGVIIIGLIAINVGLSIVQEYRAELALEALRSMLPLQARVRRNGAQVEVPAVQLVPGDAVLLRSGDLVPADLRLMESEGLEVNQAALTGESVPQTKSIAAVASTSPSEWLDVAFAGTNVVGGQGWGVVVATGARTQFGETASLVTGIREPGDFQANLTHFGAFLLRFGLLVAAAVFLSNALLGRGIVVSLTLALAVALGVVPEALPAVTATTLALGASRLAKKHVLVRRLAAVEDLSAIDTLCTDKTGTITENRTAVTDVWSLAPRSQVLEAALLASSFPERGVSIKDDAVIDAAASELDASKLPALTRRLVTRFNSETKRVCASVEEAGTPGWFFKGAAAVLVARCSHIRTSSGVEEMAKHGPEVEAAIESLQRAGSRVLAVAVADDPKDADVQPESGLTLLGLLGLSDPPRPSHRYGGSRSLRAGGPSPWQRHLQARPSCPLSRAGGPLTPEPTVIGETTEGMAGSASRTARNASLLGTPLADA